MATAVKKPRAIIEGNLFMPDRADETPAQVARRIEKYCQRVERGLF